MKPQEVILVGAGGHALSLAEIVGDKIFGYIANEPNVQMPGKWLGRDDNALTYIQEGYPVHIAYVYTGLPKMSRRHEIIESYKEKGAYFATIISDKAIITPNSEIKIGCAVMTGAIINRAILKENVIVNSGAIIEHDCVVGENTFIGPGAVVGGFAKIGRNCFIGLGARIGNNILIGDNISVAMGAIVNRNLTEPGIYHGFPLKRTLI